MLRRFGHWPALALLVFLGLPAGTALAGPDPDDAALCDQAVAGAGTGGVPREVLRAIALTETGRLVGGRLRPWPWAINREGQGYWFATRDEALAFARQSLAEGRDSFDLGCFQINYHWHGMNFPSLESMLDPDQGAAYAARFLGGLYAERGDWSAAAGAYHSQTPAKAEIYRARFDRLLGGIGLPLTSAGAVTEAGATRVRKTRPIRPKIITLTPQGPVEGPRGAATAARSAPEAPPPGAMPTRPINVAEAL